MKIYVASSWKNILHPIVVSYLRDIGYEVYDFRQLSFHWSEIDKNWEQWKPSEIRSNLEHSIANEQFILDKSAMDWADICVLVTPCGRSAHLEAGYFVGVGKPLIILLEDGVPDLMYKLATHICISIKEVEECILGLTI